MTIGRSKSAYAAGRGIEAGEPAFGDAWPKVRQLAVGELRTLAERFAEIGRQAAKGLDPEIAKL